MGEPREYGPKGDTVLFLDLIATSPPNLSEIDQNTVPSFTQEWYNLTESLSYKYGEIRIRSECGGHLRKCLDL